MSEMNNNEQINQAETTAQNESSTVSPSKKKSHPVLYAFLVGVIALACGFAGAFAAIKLNGTAAGNSVIYQAASTENTTVNAAYTGNALTTQEIAALNENRVVAIYVDITSTGFMNQTYTSQAAGSGVIVSSDGYIVTNNHVIEDASDIRVSLADGSEYEATLVGADSKTDIAVVKIDATDLSPAIIGDSDNVKVGDAVVAIGNPLGTLSGTVTDGIISALSREITIDNETFNLLQTDAAVNSGNSGGALFNNNGELIGIINAKSSGSTFGSSVEGIGFAIPVNDVTPIVEQLIDNGYVDRATLGVYLTELSSASNGYDAGVYISEVVKNSGAEKAGLQAYDRITAIDDTAVSTYAELSKALKNYNVGDVVKITVVRDKKQIDIDVTLTSPVHEDAVHD